MRIGGNTKQLGQHPHGTKMNLLFSDSKEALEGGEVKMSM